MPLRSDSIQLFLNANAQPDLAALYNKYMECQVNVAQDAGEIIKGEFKGRPWHGYTDGIQTWKSFRIPINAATTPENNDAVMRFDLSQHVEAIGMTGWDWGRKLSRWFGFDFDAISGHSDKHKKGLSQEQLDKIAKVAAEIPWVTVRKSSGGKGLHIYVFIEPVMTVNHNEHAALSRAILGKMSALAGFPFETSIDVCGQNMWVWHRKSKGTDGLALVKKGEILKSADIPGNWKDHIKVITGHRKRTLPRFVQDIQQATGDEASDFFLELTGQTVRIPLDEEHRKLTNWLETNKSQSWWDQDHHMLVTHTYYLKKAHAELNLKGVFETNSAGTEAPNDHNCFLFPLKAGGWAVRRYSMGVQEHMSWDQDGQGWTRCFYNCLPSLGQAARAAGGVENESGAFVFKEAEQALNTARKLGVIIEDLPVALRAQNATLKIHKDGRVIIKVNGDQNAHVGPMDNWLHEKGVWKRLCYAQTQGDVQEPDSRNFDDSIRHIVTETGGDCGWMIKSQESIWREEPLSHTKIMLEALVSPKEAKMILGSGIIKAWTLTNKPFQPEYPGDRQWNRDAAQFKFAPKSNPEGLHYPTWHRILKHCGKGLDDAVQNNAWAKANGILTGADYLKVWIAAMFRFPTEPLPYLFFFSSAQNTGKSIFHESLGRLMTKGYQRADAALTNKSGFNGELAGAILCAVDEISLKVEKSAGNRIKDWVTARQFPIHTKNMTPYLVPNTTHWVQCANDPSFCPIFPGDTRITMIQVPELEYGDPEAEPNNPHIMIPKLKMEQLLDIEAPDFLAEILNLDIPPSNDRLRVPVIKTLDKEVQEQANQTTLEQFISEQCVFSPGYMVSLSDFYFKFQEWAQRNADSVDITYWSKQKISKELPSNYPRGRNPKDGTHCIGNLSFEEQSEKRRKLKAFTRNSASGTPTVVLVEDTEQK